MMKKISSIIILVATLVTFTLNGAHAYAMSHGQGAGKMEQMITAQGCGVSTKCCNEQSDCFIKHESPEKSISCMHSMKDMGNAPHMQKMSHAVMPVVKKKYHADSFQKDPPTFLTEQQRE